MTAGDKESSGSRVVLSCDVAWRQLRRDPLRAYLRAQDQHFLRGDPAAELAVVKTHLATGGRYHLIYDPFAPTQGDAMIAGKSILHIVAANH